MASDKKISFKGLNSAKMTDRGIPLPEGDYLLEIERVVAIETQEKGDAFIANFRVLEAAHPDKVQEASRVKAGATGHNWYQKILPGLKRETSLGAIKAFCLAVLGVPKDNKEAVDAASAELEESMDSVTGPEQSFKGCKVRCNVVQITTKEGKPFHLHQFRPAE